MTKMTDYNDNLFIVTERARLLERSAILDIDPELFSEQLRQDLTFIRETLSTLRIQLEKSAHTFKKPENLRSLMLVNIRAEKISQILGEKDYITREECDSFSVFFKHEADSLEELLAAEAEKPGNIEQVSMEEFEFLLRDTPEEEE